MFYFQNPTAEVWTSIDQVFNAMAHLKKKHEVKDQKYSKKVTSLYLSQTCFSLLVTLPREARKIMNLKSEEKVFWIDSTNLFDPSLPGWSIYYMIAEKYL